MRLPEFRKRLEDRAADAEAFRATAPVAEVLRAIADELAELEMPAQAAVKTDRLLTTEELAERLQVERTYIWSHHHEWPFTRRIGRKLRFSEEGLDRWLRQ